MACLRIRYSYRRPSLSLRRRCRASNLYMYRRRRTNYLLIEIIYRLPLLIPRPVYPAVEYARQNRTTVVNRVFDIRPDIFLLLRLPLYGLWYR